MVWGTRGPGALGVYSFPGIFNEKQTNLTLPKSSQWLPLPQGFPGAPRGSVSWPGFLLNSTCRRVVGLGRGSLCRLFAMYSITRLVLLVLWALKRTSQACSDMWQPSMTSSPASGSRGADANSWGWLGVSHKVEPLTSLCLRGQTQCGCHSRRFESLKPSYVGVTVSHAWL